MLENLEKMAKELGLSKSGMISVALENYKKGQEKKKSHCNGSKAKIFLGVNYTVWQKKKQDISLSYSIDSIQKIGK